MTSELPLRWRKPRLVFVNSMSDLFHRDFPMTFIARVFATMARADQHVLQVRTKRPQRMARLPGERGFQFRNQMRHTEIGDDQPDASLPLPNVRLGTSIESDRYVFGPVSEAGAVARLGPSLDLTGIDWVIVGGESGPRARPMEIAWAEAIVEQCRERSGEFGISGGSRGPNPSVGVAL